MNAKTLCMSDGHKYLSCMYLMKSRFEKERLSTEAMSNGNTRSVKHFTAEINEIKRRLHSEFKTEYEELYALMTQQNKKPCDLDEIWVIEAFIKKGN